MTSFPIFFADMKELVETVSHQEFLHDRITKAIKEVFRDIGYHCKEIRIRKDGFSCVGNFSEISFEDLQKIDDFFKDYNMSIYFYNTSIGFKFTQK